LGSAPQVRVLDASANPLSGVSVSVTLNGGGLLGGTTTGTTDLAGEVSFPGLTIGGTIGNKTLTFTAGSATATSTAIDLTPGPATKLSLTTQPGGAANNTALSPQPVVQLRDAYDNLVDSVGAGITAVIASSPGGTPTLSNQTATTVSGGSATFSGLEIVGTAGSYTLRFDATGMTSVTSASLTLTAGAAAQLIIQTEPGSSATSSALLSPQPIIHVTDSGGNLVASSTAPVTAVLVPGTGTGTLGTTLTVNAVGGIVTFADLAITGTSGTYTLRFDSSGLASATSIVITLP
jgi:hypothetical protein